MKKHLLLGSVLFIAMSAFSQPANRPKPTGMLNTRLIADVKYGEERMPCNKINPIKPTALHSRSGSKTSSTTTWQSFTGSMNIWGVTSYFCKPLQWNDELDAVSFIHRKAPGYSVSPAPVGVAADGAMVVHVTLDCGNHWDSTALYANDYYWGRLPGGAIYNPPSNTDISNAYFVGTGLTTGSPGTPWNGNFYASKKLGPANYNNAPSTLLNAVQVMPTGGPYPPNVPGRHDFATYHFTATDDGKMRVLARIMDGVISDTSLMLMTGTFNNGVFDWSGKVFSPPVTVASNGVSNSVVPYLMAWNEPGTVGYVVTMGSRLGASLSNVGIQPIVYKTTNSGSTWSLENGINFNNSAYTDVKDRLEPVNANPTLKIPSFGLEGMDCSVDANNKLHIFTSLLGHVSGHLDSLFLFNQYSTEHYFWRHIPGRMPYLFDFVYDGTNANPTWSHLLIDSMSTEGPGGTSTEAGYQDNPWDMDYYQSKVKIDARIQMSRTPDGQHLLYSWAESDTAFTDSQKKWNTLPNIKVRLYDVTAGALSSTELDLTSNAIGEIANRAMFHFVSPKFKLVSKTTNSITVMVPMTISNSNPYAQLAANTHWYSCSSLAFASPGSTLNNVGIAQNTANEINNSSIYPNPAKNIATVRVNLVTTSKIQIDVLNTVGEVVKTLESNGQTGANSINIDLSGLSSGIYFVSIKVGNTLGTKKLVIE